MALSPKSDRTCDAPIMFARRTRFKGLRWLALSFWHASCCVLDGPVVELEHTWLKRYGKAASKKVAKVMRERKRGTLRSGRSGKKVTSRKQAIAIGLSEARRAGAKVPKRPRRKTRTRRASRKRSSG